MSATSGKLNWSASRNWIRRRWSIAEAVTLACSLEAAAAKAGNVTPSIAFDDMDFCDFLVSGLVLGPVYSAVSTQTVGQLVFDSVAACERR